MKKLLLLFICLLLLYSLNVCAQDVIKMKDSTEIKAKIEKITPTDITYRRATDTTGPIIIVYRQDVESITYADGEKEMMSKGTYIVPGHNRRRHYSYHRYDYGRTILSLAFLQATGENSTSGGGDVYPGFGLQYEYMLTKKKNISFYFPATLSFYTVQNAYNYNNYYSNNDYQVHSFFSMYPGVKFYPMGSNRKFSYSIGPSIAIGFGRKYNNNEVYNYDSTSNNYISTITSRSVFKTGLMINNGVSYMLKEHLYLGMELGLGLTVYSNDYRNDDLGGGQAGQEGGGAPIIQFNMKVGYRF
jgi:hypothetical protein